MLHYWKFTNPLYNHQCDPISWSIITWKDIVLLFAKWIFLYNFTTFNPLIAIAPKFASLLQLQQENKRSLGHTTNLWNIFWNKAMIMEAVKSRYYLPWKRVLPFIWTKLIPLHPWFLSAMFDWNWTSGFGVFNAFSLLSPLENGCCPTFK